MSDLVVYSKNQYADKICKNNLNRQNERIKGDTDLRIYWKNQTPAERIEWYVSNKNRDSWENEGLQQPRVLP